MTIKGGENTLNYMCYYNLIMKVVLVYLKGLTGKDTHLCFPLFKGWHLS